MATIELTDEEVKQIALMMEGSTVQLAHAEAGLALLNKFRGKDGKTK